MAKKTIKKNENTDLKALNVTENVSKNDTKCESSVGEVSYIDCVDSISVRKMKHLTPHDLESYEHLLRMLVLYYEQNLRLDESEGRPVMSENRNRYTRLSVLHKRLMGYIENKVVELEKYDWED